MVILNTNQYDILKNLIGIKKHNLNKKNMKAVFQKHKFKEDDISFLIDNKLVRINLLGEYQITSLGEKEFLNKVA